MADRELYEFAAATTDVPWSEAEACGWFNCPDAGGWLRQLPAGVLLIEDREAAVVRMLPWLEFTVGLVTQGRCPDLPKMAEMLLAAALNEEG